jgi:hypothetical protein
MAAKGRRRSRSTTVTITSRHDHESARQVFEQSTNLSAIGGYVIPTLVLDVTRDHVRSNGASRREAALVWAGFVSGTTGIVTTALVFASAGDRYGTSISPMQTGLLYAHCHTRGLTLLAQVHSHPRDAFHSGTDERSPHSAERGFLSIVIPHFGACPFDSFDSWAVFQQDTYEVWREWDAGEKAHRLAILDAAIVLP